MTKRRKSAGSNGSVVLDLDRHVPYFFTNISARLSRGASHTYLKYFGIGITEWRVLAVLAVMPDVSANQICAAVGLDKAAVSRSLQSLLQRGLVVMTDNPQDSRSRSIALTDSGTALHDEIIKVALERERLLLSCLSPSEVEGLISALRKIRAQVRTVNAYDPQLTGASSAPAAEKKQKSGAGSRAVQNRRESNLIAKPNSASPRPRAALD